MKGDQTDRRNDRRTFLKLAGVMAWELSQDRNETLLEAIHETF